MSVTGQHENSSRQGMFERFVHSEVSGSMVLLACTIAALAWANSPWAESYFDLVNTYIGVSWGDATFKMSLGHWIADGLMAIFFFVVGLEIKRELVIGQLSSFRQAVLPVGAAVGGALVPAALYALFNGAGAGASGWGVPMATDIAFALGILSLFGKRAPIGLKVFLTALAIADDLLAVLVIAFFYSANISFFALAAAGFFMLLIVAAGRLGFRQTWVYLLLAVAAWAAVFASGVHATVAGVLIAMLVPVRANIEPKDFLARSRRRLEELEKSELTRESPVQRKEQMKALDDMYLAIEDMRPAGIALEHDLHPIQSFLILPLFALFKAGVPLDADAAGMLTGSVSIGIILGLFIGKQIGITAAAWAAIQGGWADMPEGVTWPQLWGAACLGGVGFTMAIFIGELAFTSETLIAEAKLAILVASLASGIFGFLVLQRVLPKS
ncbi:MAG: Na+/H+ antiporter NhaA [Acidobacteriota bacterium]